MRTRAVWVMQADSWQQGTISQKPWHIRLVQEGVPVASDFGADPGAAQLLPPCRHARCHRRPHRQQQGRTHWCNPGIGNGSRHSSEEVGGALTKRSATTPSFFNNKRILLASKISKLSDWLPRHDYYYSLPSYSTISVAVSVVRSSVCRGPVGYP